MIQGVSSVQPDVNINLINKERTEKKTSNTSSFVRNYTDSFVRNTKQSAPVLFGLTIAWSVLDKAMRSIPMKKSFTNNLVNFFAPVLLVSSAVVAGIESVRIAKMQKEK